MPYDFCRVALSYLPKVIQKRIMSVHDLMAQAVPQSYTTLPGYARINPVAPHTVIGCDKGRAADRPTQIQGAGRIEVSHGMRHRKLETCPVIALYRIFG